LSGMGKLVAKAGRIVRTAGRGAVLGAFGLALMLVLDVVLLGGEQGTGNRER